MKNKYNKFISSYNLSNNTDQKILEKTKKIDNKKYNFKLKYAVIATCLIFISIITVNAKKINEYIEKHLYTYKNGEYEITTTINNSKTNYDDIVIENQIEKENLTLSEAIEDIGVNLLNFNNNLISHLYTLNNEETKKVESIIIEYNKITLKENKSPNKEKYISLTAKVYTSNYTSTEKDCIGVCYDNSNLGQNEYLEDITLEKLNINGRVEKFTWNDSWSKSLKGTIDYRLYFTYNNVNYELIGRNITYEEFTAYINQIEK